MKNCCLLLLSALFLLLLGCKRQVEEFDPGAPMESFALSTVGSYIVYQLDSTVYPNFGRDIAVRSYQEKHTVGAVMQDNTGRTSYRINRSIRNAAGTSNWMPAGTYMITPTGTTLEIIQNNQRILSLSAPLVPGRTWKGNRFLPDKPYQDLFSFNNDVGISDWEFRYLSVTDTFRMGTQTVDKVVTVAQVDEESKADTITVNGSSVNIPDSVTVVWLRGGSGDTIRVTAAPPRNFQTLQLINQTGRPVKLNTISIPAGKGFTFEYKDGMWSYPDLLQVVNNFARLPGTSNQSYLVGNATASVRVFTDLVDSRKIKGVTVYNRTAQNAFVEFDTALAKVPIAPGLGRFYFYDTTRRSWAVSPDPADIKTTDGFTEGTPDASKNYSVEKWAPGIGMVYQQLIMWQYVANPGGTPYNLGFGVRRRMIEYRRQ